MHFIEKEILSHHNPPGVAKAFVRYFAGLVLEMCSPEEFEIALRFSDDTMIVSSDNEIVDEHARALLGEIPPEEIWTGFLDSEEREEADLDIEGVGEEDWTGERIFAVSLSIGEYRNEQGKARHSPGVPNLRTGSKPSYRCWTHPKSGG